MLNDFIKSTGQLFTAYECTISSNDVTLQAVVQEFVVFENKQSPLVFQPMW